MTGSGPGLPPALRFLPLLPRARPPALPPAQRLAELHALLDRAAHTRDTYDGLVAASETLNKAALLASDTGQPGLATTLCWRHYDLFPPAAPLAAQLATLALQPLVNLGRLRIRTGDPSGAHAQFEAMLSAVDSGQAQVFGRPCLVGDLVAEPDERAQLRAFVWKVLLADGTRALCAAERWQDALEHLQRHRGIGRRLWDGRQVAVLTALHRRDLTTALSLLEGSDCKELWETAVATCLRTATHHLAGTNDARLINALAVTVLHLPPTAGGPVFAARLGVLACEIAPDHDGLGSHLITSVMQTADAHAASAVLDSPSVVSRLTAYQREHLRARVTHANRSEPLTGWEDTLKTICDEAADTIARHLTVQVDTAEAE